MKLKEQCKIGDDQLYTEDLIASYNGLIENIDFVDQFEESKSFHSNLSILSTLYHQGKGFQAIFSAWYLKLYSATKWKFFVDFKKGSLFF